MTRLAQLLLVLLPAPSGCASLQSFAHTADTFRREAAALLLAAQATADECETLAEPRPALCVEAQRMVELLEPYAPEPGPHGGEGTP